MHFSGEALLSTLTLISSTFASPFLSERQTSEFYLKTELAPSATDTSKANLYVTAYHTGAGFNDAVLTPDKVSKAFLNDTNLQFDLGQGDAYSWGLLLDSDTNYAAWDDVEINIGYGTGNFSFEKKHLVWNTFDNSFAGWLVCDWFHGVPQLFWRDSYYTADFVPASCSDVYLVKVAA